MIITFYSYKGGVGRSMAMANIAKWLQLQGLRVVMVDWDLEAPGLESFFTSDTAEREALRSKLGLIDLLVGYKDIFASLPRPESAEVPIAAPEPQPGQTPDSPEAREQAQSAEAERVRRAQVERMVGALTDVLPPLAHVLVPIKSSEPAAGTLLLLPAGCRSESRFTAYAENVQEFDWDDFYARYEGEAYFEWLRRQLGEAADVVLIDSRTGVAEMSGACTRQMADVIVMFCAPNDQNLEGVARMAASFTRPSIIAARGNRTLDLIMVPARVDVSEGRPVDIFESAFHAKLDRFAPAVFTSLRVGFSKLRIPYISAYAYAERLAIGDPEGVKTLQEAYVTLCAHIAALAPPASAMKRACREALLQTFGLPTILVVQLDDDLAPFTEELRARLDNGGVITVLSRTFDLVLDASLQRSGPAGTPVPVVVPVTPRTVADPRVRDICRRGRELGLGVSLVTAEPLELTPDQLPRWTRHVRVYDARTRFNDLLTNVLTPVRVQRSPFLAPAMPPRFVGRVAELDQARTALLSEANVAGTSVVSLVGMGGVGKTTLATAICHDEDVIDFFADGILWATLGTAPNLVDAYSRLVASFSADTTSFQTLDEARRVLVDLLSAKRCLLVLDDVCELSQLVTLPAGSGSRVLITTRLRDIAINSAAVILPTDAMVKDDARSLLTTGLSDLDPHEVEQLAAALDRLPLALQVANRAIRERIEIGDKPSAALSSFIEEFTQDGLAALDAGDSQDTDRSVLASFRLSAERLSPADRARLPLLAGVTPGVPVPIADIAQLLQTGHSDAEQMMRRLASASLVSYDTATRMVLLHSLTVEFFKTLDMQQKQAAAALAPDTETPSSRIYISYIRSDVREYAERVSRRLAQSFGYGSVFFDAVDIAAGQNWVAETDRVLTEASVVVALIGRDWSQRIATSTFAIHELTTAFAHDVPIIPVLLDGARMPTADALPPSLTRLANLQALEVSPSRFQSDLDRLIRSIEHFRSRRGTAPKTAPVPPPVETVSRAAMPPARAPGRFGPDERHRQGDTLVVKPAESPRPVSRRVAVRLGSAAVIIAVIGGGFFYARWSSSPPASVPAAPPSSPSPEAERLFTQAEDSYFGRSGVQDYARAASFYIAAANLGYAPAMNSLGRLYEIGQGVRKDERQAVTWYEKAASLGHPDAIASIKRLKARGPIQQ